MVLYLFRWSYPKGEPATYELKKVDNKYSLEIEYPNNPIETEVTILPN